MGNGIPPFFGIVPANLTLRNGVAKRRSDGIRVSKILSYALPVFIASFIGGCAGCVDRRTASHMHPLQLEHHNKI
jgi:hypothetical protein